MGTVLRRSGAALLWWALNPDGQEPSGERPQPRVVKGQAVAPRRVASVKRFDVTAEVHGTGSKPADDGWEWL